MQTFGATKHLQGLQTVAAHTFLDGELAGAGGAGGILVKFGWMPFVRAEDNDGVAGAESGGWRVFSQQDAGKSVKRGSRILRGWVSGFS